MGAEVVAVVALAFCGRSEDGVGVRDFYKTCGGCGVVGVVIWVVDAGQIVELPGIRKRLVGFP